MCLAEGQYVLRPWGWRKAVNEREKGPLQGQKLCQTGPRRKLILTVHRIVSPSLKFI